MNEQIVVKSTPSMMPPAISFHRGDAGQRYSNERASIVPRHMTMLAT